jgi:hypothetical protein
MKTLLLICTSFTFINCSNPNKFAASKLNDSLATIQNDTIKKFDVTILLGCGYAGAVSSQLDSTKKLVLAKDYKAVANNLKSADLLTQIASAVAMEELGRKKLVSLSKDEQNSISQIKNSNKSCSVCIGCTGHYTGTIAEILKDANTILSIKYKIGFVEKN